MALAGLTKSFGTGHLEAVIYCSKVTAALLVHDFGLPPRRVRALPMDCAVSIEGVRTTLIDANHVRPAAASLPVLASSWPASHCASRPSFTL